MLWSFFLFLLFNHVNGCWLYQGRTPLVDNLCDKAQVHYGDTAMVHAAMEKVRVDNKCLHVVVLGGSISAGHTGKRQIRHRYSDELARFLNEKYPCRGGGKHVVDNYAQGGRGTTWQLGIVSNMTFDDIDLTIVDTGVNDVEVSPDMTEVLIRALITKNPKMGIIWAWLSSLLRGGKYINTEHSKLEIIRYYDIPTFSMANAIPRRIFHKNYATDSTHPDQRGHYMITSVLLNTLENAKADTRSTWGKQLPKSLLANPEMEKLFVSKTNKVISYKLNQHGNAKQESHTRFKPYAAPQLRNRTCIAHIIPVDVDYVLPLVMYSWKDIGNGTVSLFKAPRSHVDLKEYLGDKMNKDLVFNRTMGFKWEHKATERKFVHLGKHELKPNSVIKICATGDARVQPEQLLLVKTKP